MQAQSAHLSERVVLCTSIGGARGVAAAAAALAVATTTAGSDPSAALLVDLRGSPRTVRGAVLASAAARSVEGLCRERFGLRAAARGRICFATLPDMSGDARSAAAIRSELLAELTSAEAGLGPIVAVCDSGDFRSILDAGVAYRRAVLLKATPGADRAQIALLSRELQAEGVVFKAWVPTIGLVGARRALAGLAPGGESGRRAARFAVALSAARPPTRPATPIDLGAERAQALPAVLGLAILIVALALILVAIGGAATAKGRLQRSADLAAISAARSMRDDFARLFVPAVLPSGAPNPAHLDRTLYLARARTAAATAAERNGLDGDLVDVGFPGAASITPLRVRIAAETEVKVSGARGESGESTSVSAIAEVTIPTGAAMGGSLPTMAEGGGYAGPLAYRQGKPMRPDVAVAFDRMAAAAQAAGVTLVINSAYRSDAEQQRLWDANPDPQWVAPPGTSLHRCGTELDLGPSTAYGWLATNAPRFQFTQRYSWEAWHFGYDGGPAPCSAEGNRIGAEANASDGDGSSGGDGGLPSFVPAQFRRPLLDSAARHNVSAALLAAQLMAESNFNPNASSPAGAQGIAQFMPATAASYGLTDPFDPVASIEAQARLMAELLAQFGSVELALAAYNAGPGAVAACNCVPPYPETQAYVAQIMGLLGGAGQLLGGPQVLEIRLVA
jgi:hypothetical protein